MATHSSILQASLLAQTVKKLPAIQVMQVRSLGREDPLEEDMATHSSTPSPPFPPNSRGKKFILKYADKLTPRSDTLPRRTEGRAKRLHESQNPEKLHEG